MTARFAAVLSISLPLVLPACNSTTPSAHVQNKVYLPVPDSAGTRSTRTALPEFGDGDTVLLSGESLIPLAFNRQPDITSSFETFKAEEARYDFFYASNDALTPRFRSSNTYEDARSGDPGGDGRIGVRDRAHRVEFGVDKQFFDTTTVGVSTGLESWTDDELDASQPFLSASVRYPLWGSREKLERSSDDIFRQNELNDAQLDYIKQVRRRLQLALFGFYEVLELRARVDAGKRWQLDLEALAEQIESANGRDFSSDQRRVAAELARVGAEVRNLEGRFRIEVARLKYACGIPFHTRLEFDEEPFNPFDGLQHEELLRSSIATDPEIATLRNAMRNAEVQLDLARRGKWDVALLLEGKSNFRGHGFARDDAEYSVSAGLEVSAIDPRVTSSLLRQARANIARFEHAIAAREGQIYTDTLEPLVRIETLSTSKEELVENLARFQEDYQAGLRKFLDDELDIDDLLTRRETIFEQEEEIAELANLVGANVAELCSATGKFFELLNTSVE